MTSWRNTGHRAAGEFRVASAGAIMVLRLSAARCRRRCALTGSMDAAGRCVQGAGYAGAVPAWCTAAGGAACCLSTLGTPVAGMLLGEALRARPPCGSLSLRPSTAFPDRHVRAASSPPLATPAPQGAAAQPLGRTAHPATATSTPRDALRATLSAERPEVRGDAFKGHASDTPAVMSFEPPLAL